MKKEGKLTVAHSSAGAEKPKAVDMDINLDLYENLKSLPKPERNMGLTRAQKKWWVWFGAELVSTNQFSKADLVHLQAAAIWMDARCQALKKANNLGYDGGFVQTFQGGTSNISGHVTVIEKADRALDRFSAHFGLSLKDRQRLKVKEAPTDGQLDLFEELKEMLGA